MTAVCFSGRVCASLGCIYFLAALCGSLASGRALGDTGTIDSPSLQIAIELGEARRFNGFFLETFSAESSDVQGRLAAGGDVTISHYSIGDRLQDSVVGASLVVGGDLTFPSGRVFHGDILVAGSAAGVGDAVINGLADDQALTEGTELSFDFERQFEILRRTSRTLAGLEANGTVESEFGGLHMAGDCASPAQVFELDGQQLLDAHTFDVSCIPAGATVVFNIAGSQAGLTNISLESLAANRANVLFNFHEATKLILAGVAVQGSILAPWAAIEQPQGLIHGSVMARSWNGMMQLNHVPFRGVGAGDFCALYPIALPFDTLENTAPGTTFEQLPRGTGPGNFSWLTWAGAPSAPVLAASLVAPGDSFTYLNPDDDSDWLLTPGDWAQGAPGAMNSRAIRDNLDALLGTEITVPVWNGIRGQGNNFDYQIIDFARVRLLDYRLPGNGWFTFEFLGFSHCYNRAPEAFDQQLETDANTPLDVELEGTDPDGDELTFEVTTPPEHGELIGEPPLVQYVPDSGFVGEDSFEFIALDDFLASPPARVTITVFQPNRPPEASALALETLRGEPVAIELAGTDPDGDALTFEITTPPGNGLLEGAPPLLTYQPNPDFVGTDQFEYVANDGEFSSVPAAVTITVIQPNRPPSFTSTPVIRTISGRPYRYPATATDPDEGDVLTYSVQLGPAGMTIDAQSGLVSWQPGDGDIGIVSIVLEVSDPSGARDLQSFDIEVFEANSAPTAIAQQIQTAEGIAVPVELAGTDREGDALSFRIVEAPGHGRVVGTPPNITYVPDAYYDGLDSFRFAASDGELESIPAMIEIEILGENNPPRIITEPVTPHVLGSGLSEPEPQILRDWELVEFPSNHGGSPNWSFSADGLTATQIGNNPPSTLLGDFDAVNKRIEGTWLVDTTGDDDHIGFALGYQNIYQTYVLEWKKNAQGATPRGYSFNLYDLPADGSAGSPDFLGKNTTQGVSLHSNDAGWISHRLYDYTIDYRPGDIKVSIREEGQLLEEFQITDDRFTGGRFGIFNFSQSHTIFTVKVSDLDGGNVYVYDVDAVDPDGDEVSYRLIEAPEGATIDETTGLIRWATQTEQVGRHPVVIEVEDEFGASIRQQYDLVVLDEQPVITSDPLETAFLDEPYRYLVTALDPNPNDVLTFSLVSGPDGASMDPESGLLAWMPPGVGSYDFTVRVTDTFGLSDVQSFSVEAIPKPANDPPVFTSEPIRTAFVGQLYRYTPQAVDPDGDPIQFGLIGDLPFHMQIFDGENITWQPGADQVRDWTITVDARDGKGGMAEQTFTIKVQDITGNTPPFITSAPITVAEAGAEYRYRVVAQDPDGDPLDFSLTESPEGMTIGQSDGEIVWQPTAEDVAFHSVEIRVDDGRLGHALQRFSLAVVSSLDNAPPMIESVPITTAEVGTPYQYQVQASDADGDPLSFTFVESPDGMAIDRASGRVEWEPASGQSGSNPVIIVVSDGRGGAARQEFTVLVNDPALNQSPQITSTPPTTGTVGIEWVYLVQATDPDGDALTFALRQAPAGAVIDSVAGQLRWLPGANQTGAQAFELQVTDGNGGLAVQRFDVTVQAAPVGNRPPEIVSTPPFSAKTGREYRYDPAALDPDGDTLSFNLVDGPAGMSIDSTTGQLRWTPQQVGAVSVRIEASDGEFTVFQQWQIEALDGTVPLSLELVINRQFPEIGQTVEIQLLPEAATGQVTAEVSVNGQSVPVEPDLIARFVPTTASEHQVTATIDDGFEQASAEGSFFAIDLDAEGGPEVALSSPDFDIEVTAPIPVRGAVQGMGLTRWVLAYTEIGSQDFVILAEGSDPFEDTELARFDPTLLLNGQYRIVLQAWDDQGRTNVDSREVRVTGDMKVGHFSITFEDLNVPVSGIPVTVTRTYDSRQRHKPLDFGFGWSIDYQNIRVHESRRVGFGWSLLEFRKGFFSDWCVRPNGDPVISVTLPDGQVESFIAKASPECTSIVPETSVQITFEPIDGTDSTLEATDFGLVRLIDGNLADLGAPDEPIDPDHYRLTTPEGVVFELNQGFTVQRVIEPNGTVLSFTDNGIEHSQGFALEFVRDGDGRITDIVGPDGLMLSYQYDANGDLIGSVDRVGEVTQYTYAPGQTHLLEDILDPRGVRVSRNEYDADGRLIATIDADGHRIEFEHDIDGRTEIIQDRRGNRQVLVYDDEGNVLSETNALGETTLHEYDADRNETARIDALGHRTEWTYDGRGNQLTETDPLGRTTTRSYDARNNLLTQIDASGQVILDNDYDPRNGNLLASTDALGQTTTFHWDSAIGTCSTGASRGVTDALGQRTEIVPICHGPFADRPAWQVDANGTRTTFAYDDLVRTDTETTTRTDANGVEQTLITRFAYDDAGRVIATTDPLGTTTRTEYNAIGKQAATIDPLGRRTEFEYDARGNQTLTRFPDGTTETREYDPEGNLLAETDRAGRTTKMVFDAANRLIETLLPDATPEDDSDNPRTSNEYDPAGRLTASIDERGNRTEFEYDAAGQRIATVDALGNRTEFEYDERGWLIAETDPRGHTTRREYDANGELITLLHADGTRTRYEYDAARRRTAVIDEAGIRTEFEYDPFGRLTAVILDAGGAALRTAYQYDEQGTLVTWTDALGRVRTEASDRNGQIIARSRADGQTETFSYDAVGNETGHTDYRGIVQTNSYDEHNRLTARQWSTGASENIVYDIEGNGIRWRNALGDVERVFDDQERLISELQVDGALIEVSYDATGNKAALTRVTPTGASATWRYGYDALNRLETVTGPDGETVYGYDAAGNLASIAYPDGSRDAHTFDARNRVIRIVTQTAAGVLLRDEVITRDPVGLPVMIRDAVRGREETYGYDRLRRLVEYQITDASGARSWAFEYDAVGNRTRQLACTGTATCADGTETLYTYDANDQLIQENQAGIEITSTYDANGNLTSQRGPDGTTTYTWDEQNRLSAVQTPQRQASYGYDAEGRRILRTIENQTTRYLFDPTQNHDQVLTELDPDHQIRADYSYGLARVAQIGPGGPLYYHHDQIGSTRLLTDATGAVSAAYDYQAFGELDGTETTGNPFLHHGEALDVETGWYFHRARYRDPGLGRFTSVDPFAGRFTDPTSLHDYQFAHLSPYFYTDPSGLLTLGELTTGINVNSLANVYTVADITFQVATGNFVGAGKQVVEEVVYSRFGGAFGKKLVKYTDQHLKLLFRAANRQLVRPLKLGLAPSPRALSDNLIAVGVHRPKGVQAHHIVGGVTDAGKATQRRLRALDIDLNSPTNGVFLPGCGQSGAIGMIHCGKHTRDYEETVRRLVEQAGNDKVSVLNALSEIRLELLNNTFTPLNSRAIR